MMTSKATLASENRDYVHRLLRLRQPEFSAALESAVRELCLVRFQRTGGARSARAVKTAPGRS
jgi:hypothetical protein